MREEVGGPLEAIKKNRKVHENIEECRSAKPMWFLSTGPGCELGLGVDGHMVAIRGPRKGPSHTLPRTDPQRNF
jgi:hypothetical protein